MQTPSSLKEVGTDFVIPLQHFTVIEINGEQQNDYLHGQLTINVKTLAEDHARHAAHCDFKGKVWSLSTVCRWQDNLLMLLSKGSVTQSLAQLKKYGVFSRVTLEEKGDKLFQFALCGAKAESWISDFFGSLPSAPMKTVQNQSGVVIHCDHPQDIFHVVVDTAGKEALEQWCQSESVSVYAPIVYEALAIKHGLADVSDAVVNEFVPQMMNVQALDGIDFNKGCYMGQEVVARTRYLGKNKRAGYVFCLPNAIDVTVGDTVEKAVESGWRRGGTVIRQATLGAETWFMAVLPNDTETDDRFRLASAPEQEANFLPLPYTV